MNISVTLNGKKTVFEAQSEESLMSVLHNKTSAHVKCGCLQGFCGACTVLLNNEPVAACKLPVGIIRNAEIITLDYFEKSTNLDAKYFLGWMYEHGQGVRRDYAKAIECYKASKGRRDAVKRIKTLEMSLN